MPTETPAVEALDVTRVYRPGTPHAVRSLDHVSVSIAPAEVVAVMGPSGSGKSTLLYLLGGLDEPDEGAVLLAGVDWARLEGRERAHFRRTHCGFIVQGLSLLPQATAAENVEVPLLLDGVAVAERGRRVAEVLELVELADESAKLPDQLSGGQQQRVAIARALVTDPTVVLADEPTGNLDSATGQIVAQLLVQAANERGSAVVIVTHDPSIARHAQRTIEMHSGAIRPPPAGIGAPEPVS
jgi:putative ABC transport system ATP-binding protein